MHLPRHAVPEGVVRNIVEDKNRHCIGTRIWKNLPVGVIRDLLACFIRPTRIGLRRQIQLPALRVWAPCGDNRELAVPAPKPIVMPKMIANGIPDDLVDMLS